MNPRAALRSQPARALVTAIFVVVAAGSGIAGGFLIARRGNDSTAAAADGNATTLYTCGMHPHVVQEEPGICPICKMKFTPIRNKNHDGSARVETGPQERKVLYWRAPMDPNYVSDRPGKSPMGMDLVPVYADVGETIRGKAIAITPETVQNMGIRTARVKRGPLVRELRTLGQLDYDESKLGFVTTRFEGWIEKLHVNETGQFVTRGQPLFDVYSPKVYEAQSGYLAALRTQPRIGGDGSPAWAKQQADRNVEMAVQRLRLFGISDDQIEELERTQEIRRTLTILSDFEGIVTDKMAQNGMYVNPGMRLYTVADLSKIWVQVSVYEYQLPWVRVGQEAVLELPYFPGETFRGTVVYIYPYLTELTRDTKVRLEFANPDGKLKPKMVANVRIEARLSEDALLIPREAFIDSGQRRVAFVDRGGGTFEPREIQIGIEAEGGLVQVLYGLDEHDAVVTSGQFLLDAESKLTEAMAKMMEARRVAVVRRERATSADTDTAHDHARPVSMPTDTQYACPMERHPTEKDTADQGPYFAPAPGQCPRCGMKLEPLSELEWTSKHIGETPTTMPGHVPFAEASYACPMDKHPAETDPSRSGAFLSRQPGNCEWCGMKLMPMDELEWAQLRRSSGGADVAYTCVDHPHVFSTEPGECPRDGKRLEPFKALHTCRLAEHAQVIRRAPGACPECDQVLVAYRGPWLRAELARAKAPSTAVPLRSAAFRCPTHPLVVSERPGRCPLDAGKLEPVASSVTPPALTGTPASPAEGGYACAMHASIRVGEPGNCPVCGMRLTLAAAMVTPTSVPDRIRQSVDHITEHYLAMRRLFASDTEANLGANALGIAQAADALLEQMQHPDAPPDEQSRTAVETVRRTALRMTGKDLAGDRAHFANLSQAYIRLLDRLRPDRRQWPTLTIYRCPMAHAEWVQGDKEMGNPYYGFEMLKCGEVKATK